MKKLPLSLFLATFITIAGSASCKSDDSKILESQVTDDYETSPLGKLLAGIVESNTDGENRYVVFDASTGESLVFTPDDYALANAFADLVVRDESTLHKAPPKGKDWQIAGKGKGKLDALRIAADLSKTIPKNRDFELHIDYQPDGSYIVWYRLT